MDNIEEILRALTDDGDEDCSCSETEESCDSGGIFGGLDPAVLISLMGLFDKLNCQDDNERFLLALKPLLRDENQEKIDTAVKLLKVFSLLPILRESGLLGKLF